VCVRVRVCVCMHVFPCVYVCVCVCVYVSIYIHTFKGLELSKQAAVLILKAVPLVNNQVLPVEILNT